MSAPDPSSFDGYAEEYDRYLQQGLSVSGEGREYFAQGRIAWLERCLDELSFQPKTVLDYGCGTGFSTPQLRGMPGVESVVGADVSAKSIEVARKSRRANGISFSVLSELQPGVCFDLAFCNGVFHHIPPRDRPQCLRMIFNSLRPGGLFSLWENNPWNPGTRYVMSRIPFDRDAITLSVLESSRLLTEQGFALVRRDFLFLFPRFLRWLRPVERLAVKLPLGAQYQILAQKPSSASHPS